VYNKGQQPLAKKKSKNTAVSRALIVLKLNTVLLKLIFSFFLKTNEALYFIE
jgi:hypothetical protein